ncbi:MAG: hypothetical protein H8D67_27535 [Deltaproteobacteria bacterium]|nr:hypothetical protein [Deltaproteobacteria bacterium]
MCIINDGGHINNFKLITDQVVTPIVSVSRKAIQAEGIAEANGIQEMNNALAGSGGEAIQGSENDLYMGKTVRYWPGSMTSSNSLVARSS